MATRVAAVRRLRATSGARGDARRAQVDGRAGALNVGLAAAYAGGPPGARDALAVVHAHQTLAPAFFERALAALACDARLALVAPRQRAGNVGAAADVFGAAGRARWARLLPGRAAWGAVDGARSGFLARPGALLVRARRGGRGAAARVSGWRGSGREQESRADQTRPGSSARVAFMHSLLKFYHCV